MGTAARGTDLAQELLRLLGAEKRDRRREGAGTAFPRTARASAAARLIVDEAMPESALPLVLACGGPLMDVADARAARPGISGRMTPACAVGAIGGTRFEHGRASDAVAAERILEEPESEPLPLRDSPHPFRRGTA